MALKKSSQEKIFGKKRMEKPRTKEINGKQG
jgi:hypothetical protein